MLAKDLIKRVREENESLWVQYLQNIEAGGTGGCANPKDLYALCLLTDEEILNKCRENGVYIEDREEYLNGK